jgi:aspartyl-tRNA(Asn)/glutamyl-tRNA(Gln) amidotransferase subunit B
VSADPHGYEVVIGLEVHAQLRTESKLFSPAPVTFGAAPNHNVHPICLGLPGVLPVLNARAVELAIRAALATDGAVNERSVFARKNYFYPDLPKGYQISQFEDPLATGGWIEISVANGDGDEAVKRIGLTRIHMEEDAGKSIHDSAQVGSDQTHIDLNRAGVPLLEIVSEPELRSPAEAGAYLRALREILRYLDVSDADMEKGNFRCDANVSLRPRGATALGTRTELKNLNSFRFVEDALEAEIGRQADLLERGERVEQATMCYDAGSGRTRVLRLKENADDYRYFPDPDLIPLVISAEQIERVRASLPELAAAKRRRFAAEYGLSGYDARLLTVSPALADFFEAAARDAGEPKQIANWMLRDVLQALSSQEVEIDASPITPAMLVSLVALVDEGRVTVRNARELVPELVANGGDPAALIRERGLEAVSDTGALERAVDEVLAAHPEDAERYRAGERKVLNFLMGQVMRQTSGKANPAAVREILTRRLEA